MEMYPVGDFFIELPEHKISLQVMQWIVTLLASIVFDLSFFNSKLLSRPAYF